VFSFLNKKKKSYYMIVLDGWGIGPIWGGNAISQAQTKNFTSLYRSYPHTSLNASGEFVGLPVGSPGNSEAGHLNIGAGRIVHQDQPIIDKEIEDGSFFNNPVLLGAIKHAQEHNAKLHLMGLLSLTGTHSHINHLFALLSLCKQQNFTNVHIHLFSDGRDSDSLSGIEMVNMVENKIKEIGVGEIDTVIGRFFAMDRDDRWIRIQKAYDLLTKGKGTQFLNSGAVFAGSYSRGVTDEFIEPSLIVNKSQSSPLVTDNDAIIFFNFREDRAREITAAFLADQVPELVDRQRLSNLYFATFVTYGRSKVAKQAFTPDIVNNTIAKIWSENKLTQFHTAETEKYPHVTYFFNGGVEASYPGEARMMVPSPKDVETYDLRPEMSAFKLTDNILEATKKNAFDTFVINFANADMVGHTGNLKAATLAVETVDQCLGKLMEPILANDGVAFIFADHGNVEQMVNPKTGSPDTEHTTNQVPFIIASNDLSIRDLQLLPNGNLANIAPTVLKLMNIKHDQSLMDNPLF